MPSQPGDNQGERLGELESRLVKTQDTVESFHMLDLTLTNFAKVSTGYGGTDNILYFFYKIIFIVNKEKDNII